MGAVSQSGHRIRRAKTRRKTPRIAHCQFRVDDAIVARQVFRNYGLGFDHQPVFDRGPDRHRGRFGLPPVSAHHSMWKFQRMKRAFQALVDPGLKGPTALPSNAEKLTTFLGQLCAVEVLAS